MNPCWWEVGGGKLVVKGSPNPDFELTFQSRVPRKAIFGHPRMNQTPEEIVSPYIMYVPRYFYIKMALRPCVPVFPKEKNILTGLSYA